MREWSFSRS